MVSQIQSPYQPLDTTRQQIRLLKITSDANRDQIRCDSQTFDLDVAPSYNTLSYAWGPQTNPQQIMLNDCPVCIGQNLYDFLLVFLARDGQPWIWIDQLCIDQATVAEKNHQVAMMAQVYRGSELTLVWLGPDSDHGCVAEYLQQNDDHDPDPTGMTDLQYAAMRNLMQKPYWTRHWIVQELVLSKCIKLLYGETELSWDDMAQLSVIRLSKVWVDRADPFHPFRRLHWVVNADVDEDLERWSDIAHFAQASACHDPRDKVYGTQAVLNSSLQIAVDYELSAREIYLESIRRVVIATPTKRLDLGRFADDCLELALGMSLAQIQWIRMFDHGEDMGDLRRQDLNRLKAEYFGGGSLRRSQPYRRPQTCTDWELLESFLVKHILCDEGQPGGTIRIHPSGYIVLESSGYVYV